MSARGLTTVAYGPAMVDDSSHKASRFTRDEQVFAVWLSHTVIPLAVSIIAVFGYGGVPIGFITPEIVIWLSFTILLPSFEAPIVVMLRMLKRDEYLIDVEAFRHRALPAAFATAFVLQFVGLTFLLANTGGPITSPFATFVVVYAVFSSLLTTQLWSLGFSLLVPTAYYAGMVAEYGFGSPGARASIEVYLAVTLLIIWLTVWLVFLSRLSTWRLQSSIHAEADLATLRAAVATQIWTRPAVLTRTLPARRPAAEAALAEYISEHQDLALRIVEGRRLEWLDQERMALARRLIDSFAPDAAAELLASCLNLREVRTVTRDVLAGDSVRVGTLGPDAVLPSQLLIRGARGVPSHRLLEETVRLARQEVAGAKVAAMLVGDATDWMARPASLTAQRSLATSVVVLDARRLLRLAGSSVPRRAFMSAVLEQADLSKANPFVVEGPTPSTMFFGRSDEEAAVTALLRANSAALLGGRRTGKTSLLQRIERTLADEGWLVLYADLQQVGDWESFADAISPGWDIDIPGVFRPSLMAELVREIRQQRGDAPLVILLDEVDRFLNRDQSHLDPVVPEAFFRSCRALSQEGVVQFVLAGERVVARRLWSPDSPHWNFCRPVAVRQLARKDADELLVQPLQHLEIGLSDRERFLAQAWERTSGHPHLVQHLGEQLVGLLNDRDAEHRQTLTTSDIAGITNADSYLERYITTYQGQATALEKTLCNLAAAGATTVARLSAQLIARRARQDSQALRAALRMLDLYGILESSGGELVFRAQWMPEALRQTGAAGSLDPGLVS